MTINAPIEVVLYNKNAIIPPQTVKFPVLPRKGELVTIDGICFTVSVVDWDVDVNDTYKPTLHLEIMP